MPSRVPSQNTRQPRAIELRRDGEPGKDVASGAAGGDHHGAGQVPPPKRAARVSPEGAARPWGGPAAALTAFIPRSL